MQSPSKTSISPMPTVEAAFPREKRKAQGKTPISLFTRYQRTKDSRLRERICKENMGMVEKCARAWTYKCKEPFDDLVQLGAIGLLKAIEGYDSKTGNAFSSWAVPFINGAIQHYLRDHGWGVQRIPRLIVEQYAMVVNNQRRMNKMLEAFGEPPISEEKAAKAMGIERERWQFIKQARERPAPSSLDASPIDLEDTRDSENDDEALMEALSKLEPITAECVIETYFSGLSEQEIAANKKLAVSVVRLHIAEGILKLKTLMRD